MRSIDEGQTKATAVMVWTGDCEAHSPRKIRELNEQRRGTRRNCERVSGRLSRSTQRGDFSARAALRSPRRQAGAPCEEMMARTAPLRELERLLPR